PYSLAISAYRTRISSCQEARWRRRAAPAQIQPSRPSSTRRLDTARPGAKPRASAARLDVVCYFIEGVLLDIRVTEITQSDQRLRCENGSVLRVLRDFRETSLAPYVYALLYSPILVLLYTIYSPLI